MPETTWTNFAKTLLHRTKGMPETRQHIQLVRVMLEYVCSNYLDGDKSFLLIDSSAFPHQGRPPNIGGFIPDLYARHPRTKNLIVGEAKSIQDFETKHTLAQLTEFLNYCERFSGAVFVLAVPWVIQRNAESLVRVLTSRHGLKHVDTVVLEQLPVYV